MEDKEPTTPNTDEQNEFCASFEAIALNLASIRTTVEMLKPPIHSGTAEGNEALRQWNVFRGHMQKTAAYWDRRIAQNPEMQRMWKAYQASLQTPAPVETEVAQPEVEHAA